jgi:hypothetical protein
MLVLDEYYDADEILRDDDISQNEYEVDEFKELSFDGDNEAKIGIGYLMDEVESPEEFFSP